MPYSKLIRPISFFERWYKSPSIEKNKLAYLAGLMDGEGSIKFEKWGSVRSRIGMTSKDVIYWIKTNFGGNIVKEQFTTTGKQFYVWYMNDSFTNLKLLILLYPFLILKKSKVLKAINQLQSRLSKHKPFYELKGFKFN